MSTILTDDEISKIASTPCAVVGSYVHTFARAVEAAVLAKLAQQEPVAWMYTLEYGANIANTKVSLSQLNYPFGVCGADYLPRNGDGMSYVRQTPLYTHPAPQQADRQRVPDGWRELCRRLYVELFYCDQQMTSGKRQKWKQGETVRDVLADAKAALEAAAPEAPAQAEVWFEDRNGASRKTPDDCVRFGANGVPQAVWVKGVRYVSENEAPAQASAVDERAAFEAWLGIKPCGAAHEFGWTAWQARAALAQRGGDA